MNQAIIEVAEKAAAAWRGSSEYHQAAEIIDLLISEIKSEHEKAETQWIPVSEGLPNVKKLYGNTGYVGCLVVVDSNGPKSMFMEYEQTVIRGKTVCRWKWRDRISQWKVTHWRPLPEPPKE